MDVIAYAEANRKSCIINIQCLSLESTGGVAYASFETLLALALNSENGVFQDTVTDRYPVTEKLKGFWEQLDNWADAFMGWRRLTDHSNGEETRDYYTEREPILVFASSDINYAPCSFVNFDYDEVTKKYTFNQASCSATVGYSGKFVNLTVVLVRRTPDSGLITAISHLVY